MPQHYVNLTLTDYSGESSPLKVYNGAVTAASVAGYLTDLGTFRTATDNLTLGTIEREQWVGDNTLISNILPTDPDAQRERKGLVTYVGNTTSKLYTLTIPTIRTKALDGTTSLLTPGTDLFDLSAGLVAAWVAEFEGLARTPDNDTETVTVQSIRLVGRNI
jgi:hypothetical protein